MTDDSIIVLVLLFAGVILFVSERFPVEIVALLIMTVLLGSGVVTLQEGFSGFSSPATVAVGAMFVLSTGLFKTGALNLVGDLFGRLSSRGPWITIVAMMVTIAVISAFINNTAAVAIFLPIALAVSSDMGKSPSRFLMPLSFASIFGGCCTLIGTSTNLLVSAIAVEHGIRSFGMFEFARLGLITAVVGVIYMTVVGIRMIPERRQPQPLTEAFGLGDYIVEVTLQPDSRSVGKPLNESSLVKDLGLTILDVFREGERIAVPMAETVLLANDVLRIRSDMKGIARLRERRVLLRPETKLSDADLESDDADLVEVIIAPNSMMVGRSIRDIKFRNLFGATVLALRHRGRLLHDNIADAPLSGGDALLLEVRKGHMSQLQGRRDFVLVSGVELPQSRKQHIVTALAIVAGVVVLAAAGVMPIAVSAVAGSVLMVVVGCLTLEEAYRAVEWKVIFLLAGILPLGLAVEKTGLAAIFSERIVSIAGDWGGPLVVLSILYLATSFLTEIISNNAAAVLFAPIAIVAAESIGVDPRPFLVAVTFGASASFATPIGYQTNTMIYGVGGYRFRDFVRVGLPLNFIFWLLATLLIPYLWPF